MVYTIKWWRDELKPTGIEYRRLGSASDIEANVRELVSSPVRAKRVEVHDSDGLMVACYPKRFGLA
jgi:hypothetical protein